MTHDHVRDTVNGVEIGQRRLQPKTTAEINNARRPY
jgi:hypothetical protein